MKSIISMKLALTIAAFCLAAVSLACQAETLPEPGAAQTPTEAYKMLFSAVKGKDPEKIKLMLSKNTLGLAEFAGSQQKKPVEEVVKNGFSETTFAETLPKMRDEQIKDDFASVEVFNSKSNKWEIVPFIREDGGWKAAFGDMFKGNWQSPGKSQSVIEQENANAANPNLTLQPGANVNMENVTPIQIPTNKGGNMKSLPNPAGPNAGNVNGAATTKPANVNTAQVPKAQ
jgi:hypothetical protein